MHVLKLDPLPILHKSRSSCLTHEPPSLPAAFESRSDKFGCCHAATAKESVGSLAFICSGQVPRLASCIEYASYRFIWQVGPHTCVSIMATYFCSGLSMLRMFSISRFTCSVSQKPSSMTTRSFQKQQRKTSCPTRLRLQALA